MAPLTRARAAAEALTLLDALSRAPAAAALVVAALNTAERKALRLVHSQLRDAVAEATTKMGLFEFAASAGRPPTARRWPRLEELSCRGFDSKSIQVLGAESWDRLRSLRLRLPYRDGDFRDVSCARALAAALRRMPALRALALESMALSDAAAEALFRASSSAGAAQLRSLAVTQAELTPAAARSLAAIGWRLEALDLSLNFNLGAAGVAALLAAPTFALRHLSLSYCGLDAAALLSVANAPWPLEELDLYGNDFRAAAAGPGLAALAQHAGLRELNLGECYLSAAGFKALVEAVWPALTSLRTSARYGLHLDGPHALGPAAFAGFPALEALFLEKVDLGEAGAALLASRRWTHLRRLGIPCCRLDDAGLAALARGKFPALEWLDLGGNRLRAPPTLEDVRRWAPALRRLS